MRFECIDDADYERRFGTDDRQIDAFTPRELDEPCDIVRRNRDVLNARFRCSACITRGDENDFDARRLRCLPRQRMLATTGTDNQYLHATYSSAHEVAGCGL